MFILLTLALIVSAVGLAVGFRVWTTARGARAKVGRVLTVSGGGTFLAMASILLGLSNAVPRIYAEVGALVAVALGLGAIFMASRDQFWRVN